MSLYFPKDKGVWDTNHVVRVVCFMWEGVNAVSPKDSRRTHRNNNREPRNSEERFQASIKPSALSKREESLD